MKLTGCVLDILKLADGKMEALRERVKQAKSDYRDVISIAEYPSCRWDTFKLAAEEKKQIYARSAAVYV